MSAPPVLVADQVSVRFGALRALDNVSISLATNEIVSLIGPNGAGKTTLLNVVSGFQPPEQGRVIFESRDISRQLPNRRALSGMRRTFQHAQLADGLTAVENVLVGSAAAGYPMSLLAEWLRRRSRLAELDRQRRNALTLLDSLGLADVAEVPVSRLSFGRKKLIDLARALISAPRVLLMDEPTAGLSEAEIDTLVSVIARIRDQAAILLVAHHMGFVAKVANSVVCLVAGKIIAQGSTRAVQTDPQVLAAYLGTT